MLHLFDLGGGFRSDRSAKHKSQSGFFYHRAFSFPMKADTIYLR